MLVALRFAEEIEQADVGPRGDDEEQAEEMIERAEERLTAETEAEREAREDADR